MRVVVIWLTLLYLTSGSLWTAYGNFTTDNITFIMKTLNAIRPQMINNSIYPGDAVKNISDTLNAEWAPAWNVYNFLTIQTGFDAVLYGYAFRGHWLWINQVSTSTMSLIIWKDYNCYKWVSLNFVADYNKNTTMRTQIYNWMAAFISNPGNANIVLDPWMVAFKLGTYLNNLSPNQAYTIIILPNTINSARYAYVCVAYENLLPQVYITTNRIGSTSTWITAKVLRMR